VLGPCGLLVAMHAENRGVPLVSHPWWHAVEQILGYWRSAAGTSVETSGPAPEIGLPRKESAVVCLLPMLKGQSVLLARMLESMIFAVS